MIRRERERELRSYSMALTVPEVAEILRVCTKTVYKLIKEGSIPHVKIGREIVFQRVVLLIICRILLEQWEAKRNMV